ncbi:ATP-binding protein [Solimonas sp. SE-A11]|uniref:ATP-binding protein n=1 Tax=Solimonas sp. SE-A11 TaxID=3054954 RepID=UPI00259C6822|nr:ATP-binding protein [Solimonas sp. SE-A11]MDM4770460.1 ATP-binding protein [Solimonas sp. SE-A11]
MDAYSATEKVESPRRQRMLLVWLGLGFLWLLVLALVVSGTRLAYYSKSRFSEKLDRVQRLQEAFKETSVLMGLVVELEGGQRDWLLRQDTKALQRYREAETQLPHQLARLDGMLRDRSDFRAEMQRLSRLALEERQAFSGLQGLADSQGSDEALQRSRSLPEIPAMDATRTAVVNLQMRLVEVATREQDLLNDVITRRNIAIYLTILLGAVGALGALFLLRRYYVTLHEEQQMRARMIESQRESLRKSSFLATMSHEIRTPMNAILGFSQLLLDRTGDSVSRRYVEAITVSGRSLLALIDDILDLSKVEAGKIEIRALPTSLREVADGVVAVFSQQAADKRLQLSASVDAAVPESVLLDVARLRQMLFNLVGNAVKYTDRGSVTLRISARPNPEESQLLSCVFEVQDTGVGIAQAELQRIFEPYVQAESGGAPREGSGLGLAITRQLVQRMGGSLEVESAPGRGSTFRILLPRIAAAGAPPPEEPISDEAGQERLRILVVDDVELNRELIAAMFKDSPHEMLFAPDGPTALSMVRESAPQLLLLDLLMPGMDGFETLRRLRAEPLLAPPRVIAVTATSLRGEQAELRKQFDGYVAKPFTRDGLVAEIRRVMAQGQRDQAEEAMAPLPEGVRQRLERLLVRDWPAVCAAPAMRDVKNFAQALDEVALACGRPELRDYARELNDAAFAFDALRVEALLEEFPQRGGALLAKGKEGK